MRDNLYFRVFFLLLFDVTTYCISLPFAVCCGRRFDGGYKFLVVQFLSQNHNFSVFMAMIKKRILSANHQCNIAC